MTTMKKALLPFLVLASTILAGCIVTSVYPFYTPRDVVFEPALLGAWTNSTEANERWIFEQASSNAYSVTYSSGSETNKMLAHLFKLKGQNLMDLFTVEAKNDIQPMPIPSHMLLRINEIQPGFSFTPMDYEWLAKFLEAKPKALRHHWLTSVNDSSDKRLVLTADTAELQAFILKHLQTSEAWTNGSDFKFEGALPATSADAGK